MTLDGFDAPKDGPLFSITAIRGFRQWYVDLNDGALISSNWPYRWQSGENIAVHLGTTAIADAAKCRIEIHPDTFGHVAECPRVPPCEYPVKGCSCGFYAYHSRAGYWLGMHPVNPAIMGVVECYGRCVVGEKGVRAGKAVIVALSRPVIVRDDFYEKHARWDPETLSEHVFELLRERYPLVPIFESSTTMLDALPLTGPLNGPSE